MNFSSVIFNKYYVFCCSVLHNYNIIMYIYAFLDDVYTSLYTPYLFPIDFFPTLCYNIINTVAVKERNRNEG